VQLFDSYLRHSGIACDNHTSTEPSPRLGGLSSVRSQPVSDGLRRSPHTLVSSAS